jgi:hypothetical protein
MNWFPVMKKEISGHFNGIQWVWSLHEKNRFNIGDECRLCIIFVSCERYIKIVYKFFWMKCGNCKQKVSKKHSACSTWPCDNYCKTCKIIGRFYRALTMVYNTQNYWVFGLWPNRVGVSPYLRTETNPVSETSCFSFNYLESGWWTKSKNPVILYVR